MNFSCPPHFTTPAPKWPAALLGRAAGEPRGGGHGCRAENTADRDAEHRAVILGGLHVHQGQKEEEEVREEGGEGQMYVEGKTSDEEVL